jgi:hypothetical protein
VPDDWTVWAFTDSHGVVSGLGAALREAGLVDDELHWMAPPRTALVGCGDYIDRGGDVAGMVALLRRLEQEAVDAGGVVYPARGNHESMALMSRDGATGWHESWLTYGGIATLEAFGCTGECATDPERAAAAMEAGAPGIFDWLDALPQAVRWRDVLFVHGGLALYQAPDDIGTTTEEHLWIRAGFFDTPWESEAFDSYRRDGIERVVFGHTPQWDGPRSFHGGRSLCIDTNAVGNPNMPTDARQSMTLLGLVGDGSFESARLISIDTAGAPDGRAV